MKTKLPLSADKKLNVLFRIEPGCLGPEGVKHVEQFCCYAEKAVEKLDADFVHWEILPRFDKSLPEMEYHINRKRLSHDQAARYLELFNKELDEFEGHLNDNLGELIEKYLAR